MRTVAVALLVALAAAGCGAQGVGRSDLTSELEGRTFWSVSVKDRGAPLVAGSRIMLAFSGGSVSASGGCNTLGARVRWSGSVLEVDGPLASTDLACERSLMAQDDWVGGLLAARPEVLLDGDQLTLRTPTAAVVLVDRRVAEPDRPLVGTAWVLDGIVAGDVTSSVPAGVRARVHLTSDGRLELDTGCRTLTTTVALQRSSLRVGSLPSTPAACPGGSGEVDAALTRVLAGTVTATVQGRSLTLARGGDALLLRAAG